jgi:23S rRNA pseudouridine1911/1915/1917 synthase
MEHLGHPLVGDPVYRRGRPGSTADPAAPWATFGRQALHACRLSLRHPESGKPCTWFRAPPDDMRQLMRQMRFGRTDRPRNVW